MPRRPVLHRILGITVLLLAARQRRRRAVEQFFARRTITVIIGYTAGGSYDLYGRLVARHLGKHVPGPPTVIAQNLPGAGSLKAANYLYELAPKDGTALSEAMLAMERGEVDGASSSRTAVKVGKQPWLRENKIRIILQTAPERIAELPHAPSLGEIGDTPEDKQLFALYASGSAIGRSLLAPPGVPAERTQALREAFQAMTKDQDFIADIQRLNVELEPLSGDELDQLVRRALTTPAAVRERAKLAFGG